MLVFCRYAIPLIEKILRSKTVSGNNEGGVRAMVMVPSKELADQATRNLKVSKYTMWSLDNGSISVGVGFLLC